MSNLNEMVVQFTKKRRKWNEEEDERLSSIVEQKSSIEKGFRWTDVASELGTERSGKQCRERWIFNLDPKITKAKWSLHEDTEIVRLQKIHGNKWSTIAGFLPGRTENSIKSRFNSISRFQDRAWRPNEDAIIVDYCSKYGRDWKRLSEILHNRSKNAIRIRFKELTKNGATKPSLHEKAYAVYQFLSEQDSNSQKNTIHDHYDLPTPSLEYNIRPPNLMDCKEEDFCSPEASQRYLARGTNSESSSSGQVNLDLLSKTKLASSKASTTTSLPLQSLFPENNTNFPSKKEKVDDSKSCEIHKLTTKICSLQDSDKMETIQVARDIRKPSIVTDTPLVTASEIKQVRLRFSERPNSLNRCGSRSPQQQSQTFLPVFETNLPSLQDSDSKSKVLRKRIHEETNRDSIPCEVPFEINASSLRDTSSSSSPSPSPTDDNFYDNFTRNYPMEYSPMEEDLLGNDLDDNDTNIDEQASFSEILEIFLD